jgi:hypothetical protein
MTGDFLKGWKCFKKKFEGFGVFEKFEEIE